MDFKISKKSKIKTSHIIEVSINDDAGGIFVNLPNNYTEFDVIKEYEEGILKDLNDIFYGFNLTLENIEYDGILSDANKEMELLEESYLLYVSKEQKEEIINRIENNKVFISGLFIKIDGKTYE